MVYQRYQEQEAIEDVLGNEEQIYSHHHNHMETALKSCDKSVMIQLQKKYLLEERK